ncbi:PREDICTED: L-type lectin-domain containing receptor kinase VII.1 [Nicotiana attenuata]|uniref:L-type lectin-domain containing receptor kinase VII.1 n=1 Tax=Nicotiana attenuata TaxID=49451 RepID=UPI000905B3EE|nr:PREDICTED: L-type lectin-domain containing receptor kinase VII.1 [Nicotiana attenuata]
MNQHLKTLIRYLLITIFSCFQSVSAIDFVFNGFKPSDISLFGNATIESGILTLTKDSTFSIGRALHPSKIVTKAPNSAQVLPFSTSFIFAMAPFKDRLPGHGIVFLFVPQTGIDGTTSSQNLGFLNFTNNGNPDNHVFGVEFDVFKNQEFNDINDNHVGIDVNSLASVFAHEAGYWPDKYNKFSDDGSLNEESFETLKLNNGRNYQVWIDYADFQINVTMAPVGMKRPKQPLLDFPLNLSQVFKEEMYVGFTASTGDLAQGHKILAWSFSNSNFSISDALITQGLPSFELPKDPVYRSKGFIAGITVSLLFLVVVTVVVSLFLIKRNRRMKREREEMEDWELEYWPHRISYQEIDAATKGFADENVIGIGGNGKVYKGVLSGSSEVAVKRISHESSEGARQFLAEISSLGRLKHRNLVSLRGWCKKDRRSLILVYDYMENGSLDKRLFECDETTNMLSFEDRIKILKDVASGVLYLHEGWEAKVLHRDIKASNVLLDKDMNARLGDFGLARMHDHGQVANTTRVVGTVGYLAPEFVKTGRASTQTDVFGYGVLVLEVMCGRRPIEEEGKPPLLDWLWELMRLGELINAFDRRLRTSQDFNEEEALRVLQLGMICASLDPKGRPTMRQVVKFFERNSEADESEAEDMDVYLLETLRSNTMLSNFSLSLSHGSHPTFEEIREGC